MTYSIYENLNFFKLFYDVVCISVVKIIGLKLEINPGIGESNFCIYDWFYIKGFVNH